MGSAGVRKRSTVEEPEFDKFAQEYYAMHNSSIAVSGEGPEYFSEYKVKDLAAEYRTRTGGAVRPRILDFGSGSGSSIPFFRSYFPGAQLTCVDVSARSLALAESRFPGLARFVRFDGHSLPFTLSSFDIVFAACVFHHIEHGRHDALLREWRRVLDRAGVAFVYEHNPLNPLTRRVVNSCEFDANACLIEASVLRTRLRDAGFVNVSVRHRVFFPRILRWLRPVEACLKWLPLGAQYYIIATPNSATP